MILSKESLRAQLPKVGDKLMERRTLEGKLRMGDPEPAVVVEVNQERLWYRVRFTETGFHECIKLPKVNPLPWEV